jgi:hypothetical protein
MILFNSIYVFARDDLGLSINDALQLAQFLLDNQHNIKGY